MKHKEHILIGILYLLSPFIGQLLVEKTYFIGTEFTGTAYVICWLSVVINFTLPTKLQPAAGFLVCTLIFIEYKSKKALNQAV